MNTDQREAATPPPERNPASSMTDDDLKVVVPLVQATLTNEETRFNNLNTRGVAILSASSVITALAGLFSKELLNKTDTLGDAKAAVATALITSLVLLCAAVLLIVIGVLLPWRRLAVDPAGLNGLRAAHAQYVEVTQNLRDRNKIKALCLVAAYLCFAGAVVAVAVGASSLAALAMT